MIVTLRLLKKSVNVSYFFLISVTCNFKGLLVIDNFLIT